MTDPALPPAAAVVLAAELVVQAAADRTAAPDPSEVVARMRLNGLPDPFEDDGVS